MIFNDQGYLVLHGWRSGTKGDYTRHAINSRQIKGTSLQDYRVKNTT
jgi:hypothetical protein